MKIAILGNMNNNGFSLLRFFNKIGHDTQLFLYANDNLGTNQHFNFKNDTWDYKKWENKIIRTPIINNHLQVLNNNLINWVLLNTATYLLKKIVKTNGEWLKPGFPLPHKYLDKYFVDYDLVIASGIAPAIFLKSTCILDVFYPYSTGVEFYKSEASTTELLKRTNFKYLLKLIINRVSKIQEKGIKKVKNIYNAEMGITKTYFDSIPKKFKILPIPMVYPEKSPKVVPDHVNSILNRVNLYDYTLLMTARQHWVSPKGDYKWKRIQSKNNDMFFYALKRFTQNNKVKIQVFVIEYGKDVENTKKLINKLNLEEFITWLPLMKRKEIILLLKNITISVGEFYLEEGTIWGGTAIESLSVGTPILNSLNFDKHRFKKQFGYDLPPIQHCNSIETIYQKLVYLSHKQNVKIIRDQSLYWFKKNSGLNLAKQWISNAI